MAFLLPHILTTGNLAAGFYAIVKASTGQPLLASYAIFFAAVFDMLDGRAARITGNVSRFGAEYDSIADTVSFGVAPAMIAFHAGGLGELRWAGWVLAFTYTACAALRLARFNVSSGRYHGRFDGLPSPSAAGMVVATVWFNGFLRQQGIELDLPAILPALGLAGIGLLMVSPIPYRSGKDLPIRSSFGVQAGLVITLIVLILEPGLSFFVVGALYVASGPFEIYWRKRTGQTLEELILPEAGEGDAAAESEAESRDSGSTATNVSPLVRTDQRGPS